MLPAIDSVVSEANPKFEALYRDLCTSKLNDDGTTKLDIRAQKEHETVVEELHRARVAIAKKEIIKTSLASLAYKSDDLSGEVQILVSLIAAALDHHMLGADAELLRDDIEKFKNNLPTIAPLLSKSFEKDLTTLSQIASPLDSSNPTDLLSWIADTKRDAQTQNAELHRLRLQLARELSATHDLQRRAAESSVRILEQTVHGAAARGSRAKADYLATVAEGMSKKLQLQHHQLVAATSSPEMEEGLRARAAELERDEVTLRRRVREAEERLAAYRAAGAMEGVAGEYAEIRKEIGRVEGDVARLERRGVE